MLSGHDLTSFQPPLFLSRTFYSPADSLIWVWKGFSFLFLRGENQSFKLFSFTHTPSFFTVYLVLRSFFSLSNFFYLFFAPGNFCLLNNNLWLRWIWRFRLHNFSFSFAALCNYNFYAESLLLETSPESKANSIREVFNTTNWNVIRMNFPVHFFLFFSSVPANHRNCSDLFFCLFCYL